MRYIYIFLLYFLHVLNISAQELRISGDVCNALTQEGVAHATVRLMTDDGATLLATDTTRYQLITEKGDNWENTFADKHSGATFSLIAPVKNSYQLIVEAEGFEQYRYEVAPEAGKNKVNVPTIYLMPSKKERELGEAEVRGTRIKMYYKGDTLIYNADAFNVTQRESLRKLVEQFPGAEMKDGEIRINGKLVSNILISGKNFFNGNINAALDNLPAYIVSRVKMYDKAGELSELTGRDMHDGIYVMDVHLKRQYTGTWIAKLEADGGTEKRWGAQGFLMRFDDRQMFTVNADMNNINQDRLMSDICNTADYNPVGQTESKTTRLSYYIEPNATWRFTADGSVNRKDTDKQNWQNAEIFLTPANLMLRSNEQSDSDDMTVAASTSLRARKKGGWQHSLTYNFDYTRSRCIRDARSLSYYLPAKAAWEGLPLDSIIRLEETETEDNALLHSLLNPQLTRSRSFTHRPGWQSSFVFGTDLLNFNASMKHQMLTQRDFSNYRLMTYADGDTDARRRYRYRRDYAFDLTPELEWVHKYERLRRFEGVVKPFIRYTHRYGTACHPEYRLERLTEWSGQMGWELKNLGRLPQTEWKSVCLDEANSFYSTEKEEKAEAGVRLSHKIHFKNGTQLQLDANETVYYKRRTLDYNREGADYHPQRSGVFLQPALSLKWSHESREGRIWMPEWETSYQGRQTMPALTQLLPIRDASDPLNCFIGNEDLNNTFSHLISSGYRLLHVKSGRFLHLGITYLRLHNDISTQSVYDAATGIRTYQPVNTSRTHAVQGRTEFTTSLDSKKRFYISASLSADYYQAEILSFLTDESIAGVLRNVSITPYLSLRATIGSRFRFHGSWRTTFRHVSQPGASDNYRETKLWGDFNYTLPWKIQFSNLIQTVFYAGNSQQVLDRTLTNWEITISRYFLNDRLGIHFTAHDILDQASTYSSEVTATGRLENYTDVLPRYFMLSLSCNTTWIKKKKQ